MKIFNSVQNTMVVKLGFHNFSGNNAKECLLNEEDEYRVYLQSAKLISLFPCKINACRAKKLSLVWASVHGKNKEINISMLMQTCVGEKCWLTDLPGNYYRLTS